MSVFKERKIYLESINSRSPIFGVGMNDAPYKISFNGVKCPYYIKWCSMLDRCYSKNSKKYNLSYLDCYVCSAWLTFSRFKLWMIKQDWQGMELDKDLLVQNNKVYSPETCLFLPKLVNNILARNRRVKNKRLLGANYNKINKRFYATCSINAKHNYIGCFVTELEAHEAYKEFKYKYIREMAERQPEPIKSALLRWKL